MRKEGLYDLFINGLEDIFNAENQLIDALPALVKLSSLPDLKEALAHHLKETQNQARRIEKVFNMLGISPAQVTCVGMEGIINEAEDALQNKSRSPTLDALIISCAQKVEHYEIASYGTLISWADQLDLDSDIVDLLQDTLDEESAADKKLTRIAEGSFFTSGVNKEAVSAGPSRSHLSKRKNY